MYEAARRAGLRVGADLGVIGKDNSASTHMPQKADWLSCVTVAADAGFDGLELFGARYAREADMAPDQLDAIARAARARNLTLSGHPWVELGRSAAGCAFTQA